MGYLDRTGEVRIPSKYEVAMSFLGNAAWVRENGNWKIINKVGAVLLESKSEPFRPDEDTLPSGSTNISWSKPWPFLVEKSLGGSSHAGLRIYDDTGKVIVDDKFFDIDPPRQRHCVIFRHLPGGELGRGLIDLNGKIILDPIFRDFEFVGKNIILVSKTDGQTNDPRNGYTWGVADYSGKFLVDCHCSPSLRLFRSNSLPNREMCPLVWMNLNGTKMYGWLTQDGTLIGVSEGDVYDDACSMRITPDIEDVPEPWRPR